MPVASVTAAPDHIRLRKECCRNANLEYFPFGLDFCVALNANNGATAIVVLMTVYIEVLVTVVNIAGTNTFTKIIVIRAKTSVADGYCCSYSAAPEALPPPTTTTTTTTSGGGSSSSSTSADTNTNTFCYNNYYNS